MRKSWVLLLVVAVVSFSAPAFADDIALTLIPLSGDVSAPPGSTVGWATRSRITRLCEYKARP
jgi:hypothetical protein